MSSRGAPAARWQPSHSNRSAEQLVAVDLPQDEAAHPARQPHDLLGAAVAAPSNPLEAAVMITLSPGPYTAIVSGVGNGTGVGLVEVFEVP
jgi:hypothetical protein